MQRRLGKVGARFVALFSSNKNRSELARTVNDRQREWTYSSSLYSSLIFVPIRRRIFFLDRHE